MYAPTVCKRLRSMFGISEDDFISSMLDHPLLEPGEELSSSNSNSGGGCGGESGGESGGGSGGGSGETKQSSGGGGGGGGRSGACMLFSADNHFVIKEVTKSECILLRNM